MSDRRLPTPSTVAVPSARGREAGSAYLVVLLVLVVLSLLGLTLALLTQTEMQIGANERLIQRVFYAADSGIGEATTRVLVTGDYKPKIILLKDVAGRLVPDLGNRVEVSHFVPLDGDTPCDLCQINQGNEFFKVNHAVAVTAVRSGTSGGVEVPLAQKTLAVMIELQPWVPSTQALNEALQDPAGLDKILF
jgi:PilX N-terminal